MKAHNIYKNQGIIVVLFCFITLFFIFKFINIITPFIIGFTFAYILEQIIRYFTEEIEFNKRFSIFIVLASLFIIFFVILYYLIPGLISQANELIIKLNLRKYFTEAIVNDKVVEFLNAKFPNLVGVIQIELDNISTFLFRVLNEIFSNIVQSCKVILSGATILLITPILTFYFALDMQEIFNTLKKLIPISQKNNVIKLFKDINRTISRYLRGQVIVSIIMTTYYSIALFVLQVSYALVLGIFSWLSFCMLYLGIMFSFIKTLILALVRFKNATIITYLAIIYVMGYIVESVFITPRLMGKNLNLHPLLIFLVFFYLGNFIVFFVKLFAIPMTAIIAVIIRFFIKEYKKKANYINIR